MGSGPTVWPKERDERLRVLWAEGRTARVIGMEFGLTRNAVIGRARRLKLAPRVVVARQYKPRQPRIRPITATPLLFMDLRSDTCRYPLWGPDQSGGFYCGAVTIYGSPYCATHCARCYSSAKAARDLADAVRKSRIGKKGRSAWRDRILTR